MKIEERKITVHLSQEEKNLMNKMIEFTQDFVNSTKCSFSYGCDECPLCLFCCKNVTEIKEELESFLINSK